MPTEAKGVAHGASYAAPPWHVWRVVKVAVRVGRFKIDRRRDCPPGKARRRSPQLPNAPLAPRRWPVIDFVELIGMLYASSPNTALTAIVLVLVVQWGRSPVRVDVANLFWLHLCLVQGVCHCAGCTFTLWGGVV